MRSRPGQIFILLMVWFTIELVACSFVTVNVWRSLRRCESSPCATQDRATLWDDRRGVAAVVAIQLVQPGGSVLWLAALRRANTQGLQVAKGILIGAAMVVISSLVGWFVYSTYPRPGYWSLGNMFVEVFITVPVLQGVSALFGGAVCGMMDFHFRREASAV